jgi:hypothetical protein
MASELVKEIENREADIAHAVSVVQDAITMWSNLQKMCVMDETQYVRVHDTLVETSNTLRRTREALTWKPFPANIPQGGHGEYLVSRTFVSGGRTVHKVQTSAYWENSSRTKGGPDT